MMPRKSTLLELVGVLCTQGDTVKYVSLIYDRIEHINPNPKCQLNLVTF